MISLGRQAGRTFRLPYLTRLPFSMLRQASRRAGDVLQRLVRVCSVSSAMDTLLLWHGPPGGLLLADPAALHRLLTTVTKGAFLSRPMPAATLKALAAAAAGGGGAAGGMASGSNGVLQPGLVSREGGRGGG